MVDMDMLVASNICSRLREKGMKQLELAKRLKVSPQTMSKMLSGARSITIGELKSIASIFNIPMEKLFSSSGESPQTYLDNRAYMGHVKSEETKNCIDVADKLIDLFHAQQSLRDSFEQAAKHENILS